MVQSLSVLTYSNLSKYRYANDLDDESLMFFHDDDEPELTDGTDDVDYNNYKGIYHDEEEQTEKYQ
jgi:hypothetical protein